MRRDSPWLLTVALCPAGDRTGEHGEQGWCQWRDSNSRMQCRLIYSQLPLAAWVHWHESVQQDVRRTDNDSDTESAGLPTPSKKTLPPTALWLVGYPSFRFMTRGRGDLVHPQGLEP